MMKNKLNLISNIIGIIFIITTLLLLGIIIYFDFLSAKYYIASVLTLTIIGILVSVILYHKKTDTKIKLVTTIIASIIIIIEAIISGFFLKTCSFVNKTNTNNLIFENFYVLVLNDNNKEDVNELDNISTYDEKSELYENGLSNLKDEYDNNIIEEDNVSVLGNKLVSGEVEAIFVSKTHKKILEDEIDGFEGNIKSIYTTRVSSKEKEKKVDVKDTKTTKVRNTFTVYLSGIDTGGDITNRGRSDVNMLLTVNTTNKEILLTSIPRDYKININGSLDKLTHTGIYGINTSISSIEELLNIKIDYYVKVNFTTLTKIVDSIGGININSDKSFRAHTNKDVYINEGNNYLDGVGALAYARERYAYIDGDRHRVSNQQDVVTAIINNINTKKIVSDYNKILKNLENNIETNIDMKDISNLIKYNIENSGNWNIKRYSLNGSDSYNDTYSIGVCYVMEPDYETVVNGTIYINSMIEGKKLKEIIGE